MSQQVACLVWSHKFLVVLVGGLLVGSILACSSVDLFASSTNKVVQENTVIALEATIQALQTQQAVSQPVPPVVVVTATPTVTPLPSPTPLFTATLPPAVTPVPPPTATPVVPFATNTPAAQSRTIIIVVTPTSPPPPTPYPEVPIAVSPWEGAIVAQEREILLHWSWNGVLQRPDEFFEIKLRPDGQSRSAYIAQERGTSHTLKANLAGGRYQWTIQIVEGYFKNNSGHADDWVFVRFRSPESEPRLIIVDDSARDRDDDDDEGPPVSQSQAEPPDPRLPYGLAIASLAFAVFGALARAVNPGAGFVGDQYHTTDKSALHIRRDSHVVKHRILIIVAGIVLAFPTLACGAVGVYDPQATQSAMEGTVTALQATISAMELKIANKQPGSTPAVVVVTATPSATLQSTPGSSTVISASSLGQTVDLTSTPAPTPITVTSADRVVTLVATFTLTPVPKAYIEAPVPIQPRPGVVVEEGKEILLHWSWNGVLAPGERFDIKIRPDGQNRSAYVAWEDGQAHDLRANLAPGRYFWTVQIVQGYYQNNVQEPENCIFEAFLSPESAPRLIIVAARTHDDDDNGRKTPTATPVPESEGSGTSEATDPTTVTPGHSTNAEQTDQTDENSDKDASD